MTQKKTNKFLIGFLILCGITVLLLATAAGLWFHGRQALQHTDIAPQLPIPQPEPEPENPEGPEAPPDDTILDSYTIRYDGKYYRYRESMCNILLIGVDGRGTPVRSETFGNANQADVIVLAAMDLETGKLTLISVSRDAMCDIAVLDETGEETGTAHAQLALSYAYGDGMERSCELTRDAVSGLFYGLPIHGYGALYLDGLPVLNDAVDGVTLTVSERFPYTVLPTGEILNPGAETTLNGAMAQRYIRSRESTIEGNNDRMQRQKQYMLALFQTLKSALKADPAKMLSVYDIVSDYVVTDLTLDRMLYLATQAVRMQFDGEVHNVIGESVLGKENHAQYLVDEEALSALMLQVFYEEVTP